MSTFPAGPKWSLRSTALLATTALGVGAVFYALPAGGTTPAGNPGPAALTSITRAIDKAHLHHLTLTQGSRLVRKLRS
ncbi:hypothetical protein [Kitasatospora sp. NPDC087314]|uniref:hypothetical protein n=1 Tax=Kitasatospora sp. NPDC087314 TaxID=3364068 RepID=UPI0037FC7BF8